MKKKIIGIFVVMLLMGTIYPITVTANDTFGNTITVDDEGDGDYTSIQDAIDNANPGDTIEVYSGTYYEDVNVTVQVTLRGVPNELGSGDDTGKPIVNAANAIMLSADEIIFTGFIIGMQGGGHGIIIYSGSNTITGNDVSKCDVAVGVYSDSNTIRSNNIVDNWQGIGVVGSNNIVEQNNFIDNNKPPTYTPPGFDAIIIGGILFGFPTNNNFDKNYWDNWPAPVPKPIFKCLMFYIPYSVTFDKHPAKEPYDI